MPFRQKSPIFCDKKCEATTIFPTAPEEAGKGGEGGVSGRVGSPPLPPLPPSAGPVAKAVTRRAVFSSRGENWRAMKNVDHDLDFV